MDPTNEDDRYYQPYTVRNHNVLPVQEIIKEITMTHPVAVFLLIASSLCFLFAAVNVRSPINLVALGLFLWVILRGVYTVFPQ